MATTKVEERKRGIGVQDETESGLGAWELRDLPDPPRPKGRQWIGVVGPGVIVLGASIGSGEFLLGPAAFIQYGFVILWITGLATFFQTVYNQEAMRYTLYTGEPILTGFMRTRPKSSVWAWVYSIFFFLQLGIPGWAAASAGAFFFLFTGRVAAETEQNTVYFIAVAAYLTCVGIVLIGRKIERTLEVLNWIMVAIILSAFFLLVLFLTAPSTWFEALVGYVGVSPTEGFAPIPPNIDLFLIGAVAAYAAAGGMTNLVLTNWARDKGYGMAGEAGYIPAMVGGEEVHLAHTGYIFDPEKQGMMDRWRGWWSILKADQWGVFFIGALLGMVLPGILYITFLRGESLTDLGVAAALADAMKSEYGALIGTFIAFMGAWILFKTQLDTLEGMVRGLTDVLWTGWHRMRERGDVRKIYYPVLIVIVIMGLIILRLPQPLALLALGANMAGIIFVVSAIHILKLNSKFLPKAVQPPMWRKVSLVGMAIFYGIFVWLFLFGAPPWNIVLGQSPINTDKGFVFQAPALMTKTE